MSRIKICNDVPVYKAADLPSVGRFADFYSCILNQRICGSIYVAQIYPAYGIVIKNKIFNLQVPF